MKKLLAPVVALALAPALAGAAAAEERAGDLPGDLIDEPDIGPGPSMVARLEKKLTLFSNQVGLHLAALSADMVQLEVDVGERTAHLRVGGDYAGAFLLRVDSDVEFARGGARVKAHVDVGVAGHRLNLELPAFDLVPRSLDGERYLELRLPLIETRF